MYAKSLLIYHIRKSKIIYFIQNSFNTIFDLSFITLGKKKKAKNLFWTKSFNIIFLLF